ncbi:MAG: MBL fold metallo-hydrolase [Chloroflexi bacterium]|nr:MBL fold metallo-hydrolase [Chloroflexota bacterium]
MVKVTEVADGIYHIEGEAKTPDTRDYMVSYLVRGQRAALIETGPTNHGPLIEDGLRQLKLDLKELAYIIPTHIHIDHGGGAGWWARKLPDVKIVLHPLGVPHMIDPTRLNASTKMAFGDSFEARYGAIQPVPPGQVHTVSDGESLSLGGRDLQVFFTPGHAPHHISLMDSRTKGLFSGEALGIPMEGSEIPFPACAPPAFDMEQYIATAERLRRLGPSVIFYSHDGVGRDVSRLIDLVEFHTRAYGAIIEGAVKGGESPEQMGNRLKDYVFKTTGKITDYSPEMAVSGFALYFKRKAEKK